mgnify:CR=1 FL=1
MWVFVLSLLGVGIVIGIIGIVKAIKSRMRDLDAALLCGISSVICLTASRLAHFL